MLIFKCFICSCVFPAPPPPRVKKLFLFTEIQLLTFLMCSFLIRKPGVPDARSQERQLTDSGVMPEKMKDILQDEKGALTKLNTEALKILRKPPQTDDVLWRRIRQRVSTASLTISDLEHMTTFHEMPDGSIITKTGVDKLLYETGTMVETFNGVIEMAKGVFKARRG